MSNILDKLETEKFYRREGFEIPEDHRIVELFEGYSVYLEFDILIIAKTIKVDKIRCKETQFVYQFIKEIQETDYLFEGVDLTPQGYWLFIECDESDIQDIPLNWDWTMSRVKHLMKWVKSYGKSERFKLVFKKRIWSIRYRLSLERFSPAKIEGIFYELKRMYLVKNAYRDYCKLDKLVKIAGLLSLIDDIENNNKRRFIKSGKMLVQNTVPEGSQSFLGETEWIRRIDEYIEKNSFLKNHSALSLKKRFLTNFLESPNYCSSFYSYTVSDTNMKLKKNGHITINIYGINLFENHSFETPSYSIALEHIDTVIVNKDSLLLKFNNIEEEKILRLKLVSVVKEDIAYDIVSYMLISLREPKKLFYAYNFISRYFTYGKQKNKLMKDSALKPMINKCLEEIARLRNVDIELKNLPYSRKFEMGIKPQNNHGSFSIYKQRKKVNVEEQLKKSNSKTFVENRRSSRSKRNSRVEIPGLMRMNSNFDLKQRGKIRKGANSTRMDNIEQEVKTHRSKKIEAGDRKIPFSRGSVSEMEEKFGFGSVLGGKRQNNKNEFNDSDSEGNSSGVGVEEGKFNDGTQKPDIVPRLDFQGNLARSLMQFGGMESIGEGQEYEEEMSDTS